MCPDSDDQIPSHLDMEFTDNKEHDPAVWSKRKKQIENMKGGAQKEQKRTIERLASKVKKEKKAHIPARVVGPDNGSGYRDPWSSSQVEEKLQSRHIYFDGSLKMSGNSMMIAPTVAMKQNCKILHEK